MSSEDESHSVDNISVALDFGESWPESPERPFLRGREWVEDLEGSVARPGPSKKGKARARGFVSSTRPSEQPMHEASSLTEGDIASLEKRYRC